MIKPNILIVDDLSINRLLLSEIIEGMGYRFSEAEHGKEALQKLRDESYDIILMDIDMPVMNGVETTRFIRKCFKNKKRNIPIVAITAYNPQNYFENYIEIGFNDLVTKPYTIKKLCSIIESFIGAV